MPTQEELKALRDEARSALIEDAFSENPTLPANVRERVIENTFYDYVKQQQQQQLQQKRAARAAVASSKSYLNNLAAEQGEGWAAPAQQAYDQTSNRAKELETKLDEKNNYFLTSQKENPNAAKAKEEAAQTESELTKAQEQMQKIEADVKAAQSKQAERKAFADYLQRDSENKAQYDKRMQQNGYSSIKVYKEAVSAADLLKQWRDDTDMKLKAAQNGSGYYGAASTYEQDKKRQEEDISRYSKELDDLQRRLDAATSFSKYAERFITHDLGAQQAIAEGWNLEAERYQNALGKAKNQAAQVDVDQQAYATEHRMSLEMQTHPTDEWTQEQKNQFYLRLKEFGEENAASYAAGVNSALKDAKTQADREAIAEIAANASGGKLSKIGQDIVGVGMQVASLPSRVISYLQKLESIHQTGYYTGRDQLNYGDVADIYTQSRAGQINKDYPGRADIPIVGEKGLGDLYQLVPSMAQSILYGGALGEIGTLGAFFFQAADQSFDEAKARGASDQNALIYSFLSGAAEAATEVFSVEQLLKGDWANSFGKQLAKQFGTEMSEEGMSAILGVVNDKIAAMSTGERTEIQNQVDALVRQGMSRKDAEKQVWKETVSGIAWEALAGGLSGFGSGVVMGGPQAAVNKLYQTIQQREQQNKLQAKAENMVEQAAKPVAENATTDTPTRPSNPLYDSLQTAQKAAGAQEAPGGQVTQPTAETTPQGAGTTQDGQTSAQAAEEPTKSNVQRFQEIQKRLEEINNALNENPDEEIASSLYEEGEALYQESRQLESLPEVIQQKRVDAGEVSKGFGTVENHIDNRTDKDLSKPGVKAFQFDYPELHQYFVDVAQELIADVEYAEKLTKANMYELGSAIESGPVRQLMDMGLTKPEIIKALQDIIANNGQENYAKAKKVERVLSQMMTDGWRDLKNQNHDAVPDYIAAKDSINGAVKSDSWEKYLADHELSLIDGLTTEEQLRADWERMHPQEEAAAVAEPEPAPQPKTEGTQSEQSATDSRGYTGPLVDTQDRVFETQLTDEEKQIPGLTADEARHIQHHDAEVDIRAKERIAADAEQARADLLAAESWSDEDTATAGYIIQAELEAAEKAGSVEERAAIYKRLAELKKQWNKQGTEQGRALRQRQRFVAEDMVAAAADILYGDKGGKNEKALRKLNPQAKDAIMGKVREYAKRFNDMQKNGGTVGDLIQLIKDVSVQRRTTGLFSRENGRAVDFALSEVAKQEGGVDFLKELATTQIKSIASDYIKPGIIDRIKSWRFMAMLSNSATTTANAGSNFVFGSFMEALSGNLALPFDMLMSQVTGQREVAGELGAFSKTKWQGSYDAMLRSFLEVTLDAETEQADYGYKELKGGTFKMVGNPIERLLATIQKYQGYALKTTDQAAKGGTEAQVRKGLGKLAESGKAKAENIDALAQQEAKYRTLQTEGRVSKAVNTVRGAFDEAFHIGNERTGKYGIASDIMPFAQVPANAVAVTLESNPAINVWNALLQTAKVLSDGKNAEPGQQAKAARAWGRVVNGVAVAATFAALAARGYLRDEDDDNKDIATQRKAEGRSGVQLNISALLRGDPSEREDDLWINFSWIPPLNGLANFGADLYRAYTEDGHISFKDISLASGEALASAFMDFPAVSKISSMIKTYQYSEADGILGKLLETGVTGAAQTASSILIPNAVRAVAAGIDPYERDVYNTDTYGEGIKNNLISGIPGLRETLPERLDTFGQPVKNEGGLLHFLDKTVIPGDVNRHDRQSAASKYVEDLIAQTGNKKLQPSRNPPYKATLGDGDDKQNVELTAAERREYQQTRGNAIYEMTEALAESRAMRGTTDGQKALFNAIKNAANHQAEAELAESRGIEQSPTQIGGKDFLSFSEMGAPESVLDRLAENGMTGAARNTLWEIMRGSGSTPKQFAQAAETLDPDGNGRASQADLYAYLKDKSDLTAEEKQRIWSAYNPTGKTSYADYAAKNGGDESKATKSSGNALYDYYADRMKNAK